MLELTIKIEGEVADAKVDGDINSATPFQVVQALVEVQKWIIDEYYTGDREDLAEYLNSLYQKEIQRITLH